MNSATLLPGQSLSLPTTFTAAAIHDGMLAGFRAKEALRWLDHVLTPAFRVRSMVWSFQQLERLDVRSMALRSAGAAQMIIIAGSSGVPLAGHIERWLDACLFEHRVRRTLLVALADEEPCGTGRQGGSFLHTIRQFATRWQAQVMTGEEFDEEVHPEFVKQRFHSQALAAVPPSSRHLTPGLDLPPRFYGIND